MPEPDINRLPAHIRAALTTPQELEADRTAKAERIERIRAEYHRRLTEARAQWHRINGWTTPVPDDLAASIRDRINEEIRTGQLD